MFSTKHLHFYAKVHRINSLNLINSLLTTLLIKLSSYSTYGANLHFYDQIDPSLCPALDLKELQMFI